MALRCLATARGKALSSRRTAEADPGCLDFGVFVKGVQRLVTPHPAWPEAATGHRGVVLVVRVDMNRGGACKATRKPGSPDAQGRPRSVSSARVATAISRACLRLWRATQTL